MGAETRASIVDIHVIKEKLASLDIIHIVVGSNISIKGDNKFAYIGIVGTKPAGTPRPTINLFLLLALFVKLFV